MAMWKGMWPDSMHFRNLSKSFKILEITNLGFPSQTSGFGTNPKIFQTMGSLGMFVWEKHDQTSIAFRWDGFGESQIDFSSEGPAEITSIRLDTISNPSLYIIIYIQHIYIHLPSIFYFIIYFLILYPFSSHFRSEKSTIETAPRQRRWCSSIVRRPVPTSMRPSCGASRKKTRGKCMGKHTKSYWAILIVSFPMKHGDFP